MDPLTSVVWKLRKKVNTSFPQRMTNYGKHYMYIGTNPAAVHEYSLIWLAVYVPARCRYAGSSGARFFISPKNGWAWVWEVVISS